MYEWIFGAMVFACIFMVAVCLLQMIFGIDPTPRLEAAMQVFFGRDFRLPKERKSKRTRKRR